MGYEDRFHNNLGNGNRRVSPKGSPDDVTGISSNHIAVSQIAQELPAPDRRAWLQDLFRPETRDEEADRLDREVLTRFGSPDEPTSLAFGLQWAAKRLQEGATWRKSRRIF